MTPILLTLLWLWVFWCLYKIVVGDYRAWLSGRLSGIPLWLSMPSLAAGWLVDWLTNWTIASIAFVEWPKHPLELVTGRLTRYLLSDPQTEAEKIRKHHAGIICSKLLDPYDPNPAGHCTDQPITK
ncbi:MAG: hypothetical protein KGL39_16675 [Patescibacteria group bacterium]|nr:hypothetical protein [Patescibacteria group bacterium]